MKYGYLEYSSTFSADIEEVWWLVTSFLWGILKLTSTLPLADGGNSDWAFGQVVPVVLLAAPVLAMAEYLYPGKLTQSLDS